MRASRIPCHFQTASQAFRGAYRPSIVSQPTSKPSQYRPFSPQSIRRAPRSSPIESPTSPGFISTAPQSPVKDGPGDSSVSASAPSLSTLLQANNGCTIEANRPGRSSQEKEDLPRVYSPTEKIVDTDMDKLRVMISHERQKGPVLREKGRSENLSSTGKLAGKRCIITGASRGIGKAIAQRFAEEGARCLLVGRDSARLKEVAAELQVCELLPHGKGYGKAHSILEGDVGKEEFWQVFKKDNTIDILVNCAGVAHYSPLVATTSASMEQMLQTNLMGTMLGSKIVGRHMMKNREGSIINVASLLGVKGGAGSAAYAASKAGIIGFSRALSAELGERNVRVNVIVPGYIATDMTNAMTPEAHSAALNAIPLKRFGEAPEIADAAVFLATNKYASNCVLNIDGGLSAT